MTAFEDLVRPTTLAACFADVRRRSPAAGADGITPGKYESDLDARLERLSEALATGTWQPARLVRLQQRKAGGGVRRLAIPTVEDRIVIEVLRRAIEPKIEERLSPAAFAYRPGRSARSAVETVARLIEQGGRWVAVADIREFFDSIRHADLARELDGLECVPRVRELLDRMLMRHAIQSGRGLAQGSALSPALSNLALLPLDHALLDEGLRLVRYCDNLCIPTQSRATAQHALAAVRRETTRRGLALKREVSQVAEVRAGFVWLGFWLGLDGRRVSDGAVQALRARLDVAGKGLAGTPLRGRLRPIVRGWARYFDVELPEGASLGQFDDVARALIAEQGGAVGDGDGEPEAIAHWDEHDLEEDDPAPFVAHRSEIDVLLAEADRLAAAGSYGEAEEAYAEAQRLEASPSTNAGSESPADPVWDDEPIDAFLGLFCAGQDEHEAAAVRAEAGRREFIRIERPPSPADVRAHLLGRTALAVWPRLSDGKCALGVLDIDGSGPDADIAVQAHADALCSVVRSWGLQALVEHTGGRGMHLWIPFEPRVSANDVAALLSRLVREAGHPGEGVRVDRLPGGDGAPDLHGQSITLPLGCHVETGARSRLAWVNGREVMSDLSGLFAGAPNDPKRLTELLSADDPRITAPNVAVPSARRTAEPIGIGTSVGRVMEGCAVLRHLADKAMAVGHLDHAERLSLLYSLGHLGEAGRRAIHEIVGRCDNYDAAETSRQIDRFGGLPISCTRMREKHVTADLAPLCACDFGDVRRRGGYPTPLLHAVGFRRAWRDELRGRRVAEAVVREQPPQDIVAVPEEALPRAGREGDGERSEGDQLEGQSSGVVVAGVPPHLWA